MITKKYIPPTELKFYWEYLRPKLELILRKSPEQWIPEEIFADILNGHSTLWIAFNVDKPIAFIVGQVQKEQTFHLWAGYCDPKIDDDVKWHMIEEVAQKMKCNKISFESWRKGWSRKATRFGFKPRKYIKELL